MKKLNKLFLALAGISAVSAGLAVGNVSVAQNSVNPAKADVAAVVHRLYVINNAWSEKYQLGIYIWGSLLTSYNNTWASSVDMNRIDESGGSVSYGLFYYDIPDDASFIIRQKKDASGARYQSADITPSSFGYSNLWSSQVLRVNWNNSGKATFETVDGGLDNTSQLGNVLSYIVTCDSSSVYGYNAYPQLKGTFFDHTDPTITSSSDATVRDYSWSDSSVYNSSTHTYVSLSDRGTTSTVVGKIARLKTNYESGANHAKVVSISADDPSSTLVLGGIAALAVLAAGGYFFVRKKKSN